MCLAIALYVVSPAQEKHSMLIHITVYFVILFCKELQTKAYEGLHAKVRASYYLGKYCWNR